MLNKALVAQCSAEGKPLLLVQPLTYMNRSGEAVSALARKYNVPFVQLLVVYDDMDLSPGTIRLRGRGGSGGHRGLQSIIDLLGEEALPRLRLGIGKPPPGVDPALYVLEPAPPDEEDLLAVAVEKAAEAVLSYVREGLDEAMNKYNRALPSGQ